MKKTETNVDKNRNKAKQQREQWQTKKLEKILNMSDEELLNALKTKGLPTYGTKSERIERLKKHYGVTAQGLSQKDKVVNKINEIKREREERRAENQRAREKKAKKEKINEALGRKGDVDFEQMIEKQKYQVHKLTDHQWSNEMKLCVCVRKRPIFKKELLEGDNDCLSVANPEVKIFNQKLKVDGITKYLEDTNFKFDNTFNENETTKDLYDCSISPILDEMFNNGMLTIFAYGQTGSGKTFTMQGIQEYSIYEIFKIRDQKYQNYTIELSFYEIYGGRCYDLLDNKKKVEILEGSDNMVTIQGLVEKDMPSSQEMLEAIKFAFNQRTTHSTIHNDTSSRSHAICVIKSKDENGKIKGKYIVCDLAGSERAQDTQSNKRQRRLEGAEINKSLLSLKECIRAMNEGHGHIPFRASKLTLALRDSFIQKKYKNRVVVIACICPGSSSADHSINTLRYADRLKQKRITSASYNYPQEEIKEKRIEQELLPFDNNSNVIQKKKQLKKIDSKQNFDIQQKSKKIEPSKLFPKESPKKLFKQISSGEDKKDEPKNYPIPNKQPPIPINKDQLKSKHHEELNFMRETIKEDSLIQNQGDVDPSEDFVQFHEKVSDIIDLHDEMLALHLNIIREDAQLLTKESEIISKAQSEDDDYDIDEYVDKIDEIFEKNSIYINHQLRKQKHLEKHQRRRKKSP